MKRCLTDRALSRLLAELGKPEERAHLAVCAPCTTRYRRLESEMAEVAYVLAATPWPRVRRMPATGRWIAAAAALAAVVAGIWLSTETGSRIQVAPSSHRDPQRVAAAMADINSALFSVDGEPRGPAAALELDATHEADCETTTPLAGIYCAGGALGLGEGTGALDLEVNGQSTSPAEGRDEGA
jgi:hypothetical protein